MRKLLLFSCLLSACGPVPRPVLPDPVVVSLALRPGKPVVAAGRRIQLVAEAVAEDGQSFDQNELVEWSLDNTNIATINALGQVKGVAAGQVTARAVHPDGPAATIVVDVIASDVDLMLLTPAASRLAVGATLQLVATAKLLSGALEDVSTRGTWASNNVGVAKVTPEGSVSCVSVGQVTVANSFLGVRGVCSVVCE